jgi:MFS family permease
MNLDWKQLSVYLSMFISLSPYTMISTFLPGIASDKGVPIWVIGLIFSMDPIAGLITSVLLGNYMYKVGRKFCLGLGLFFTALCVFVLVPIEDIDYTGLLVVCFSSRILAGLSSGLADNASVSIFVSDYPDNIEIMIGRVEAAVGVGLITGPLIGAIIVSTDLFYSLIVCGVVVILLIPLCLKMLGTLKVYQIENTESNPWSLLFKLVKNI